MAQNLNDMLRFLLMNRRGGSAVPLGGGQMGNDFGGNNSDFPATRMPVSALSMNPTDDSVRNRYIMGRQGVYTTESSGQDNGNIIPPNTSPTSPQGIGPLGPLSTMGGGGATNPAAAGNNLDYITQASRDLYESSRQAPTYTPEADPDPSQYKRKKWKDVLYAIAANVATANPQTISTPGGFLGALVGGGIGGYGSKRTVKNSAGQSAEVGAYGQSLYGQDKSEVDQRNKQRLDEFKIKSGTYDKRVDNLRGAVQAGTSVVNAELQDASRKELEAQGRDRVRQGDERIAQSKRRDADLEFGRQWARTHPSMQQAKMKMGDRTVLAQFNPKTGEFSAVKNEKGQYVEAPDTAFQLFELKTQHEAAKEAAAAAVPAPDAEQILKEATDEVKGDGDYKNLNEDEVQARIMTKYRAKLEKAKGEYKSNVGRAKAGAAGTTTGGGGLPTSNKSLRDMIREARKKTGVSK